MIALHCVSRQHRSKAGQDLRGVKAPGVRSTLANVDIAHANASRSWRSPVVEREHPPRDIDSEDPARPVEHRGGIRQRLEQGGAITAELAGGRGFHASPSAGDPPI